MFITNAINPQKVIKTETPNRKIKNIMTNKIQVNNHPLNKIPSNQKLILNNKENENPNIKKSPSQEKEKPSIQLQAHERAKENRVKSQYYSSNLNTTKQSPIKKILFVKNLCYKSTKTSKNSSLDNKNQEAASTSQEKEKHQSLNHEIHRNTSFDKEAFERKSYSHGNKDFIENESQIFQESKPIEKNILEFRANDNVFNNESQASYRMAIVPNELHPKMTQFNEKYSTYPNQNQHHIQNLNQTHNQHQNKPGMTRMSSFDCGISSGTSENLYGKHNINNKMCPNIQSSDLSELESFKKNNFVFPQHKRENSKALISMDKEKKESLSSKKRNSRIKITYKNPEKFKESFNEDLVTEESEITISSPSHPIFSEKMKLNNSLNLESERDSKSSMSKNVFEESTLLETKKIENSLNLSDEFSRITLNESKQSNKSGSIEKKHDQKRSCVNHPEKEARFRLNKQIERPFYCEKCSAYLVTKEGYEVVERLETESNKIQVEKTNRLEKLKNFIFSMEVMEPKLEKSKINIRHLEQEVNIIIKKGQEEIEKYYKKLHETLDSHKEGTIKALHFHSQKILLEISMLKKNLHQNEGELSFMKSDILPNIDLIVNEDNLPDESFKQIIMMHEQKLKSIDSLVLKISNLVEGKEHKMIVKTVEIPLSELKSTLNTLERTQIVFVDKIVRIELREPISGTQHFESFREENSPDNEAKKDFSFDDENIDASFYVPSSKKKQRNENPATAENFYELTDSIRLSFGNRFETSPSSMRSPTFKAI